MLFEFQEFVMRMLIGINLNFELKLHIFEDIGVQSCHFVQNFRQKKSIEFDLRYLQNIQAKFKI